MLIVRATVNITVDPTGANHGPIVNGSDLAMAVLDEPNTLLDCQLFNEGADIWERGVYTDIVLKIPTGEMVDGLWLDSEFLLYQGEQCTGRGCITEIQYRADGITEFRGHLPLVI